MATRKRLVALGIDPGRTTGLAVLEFTRRGVSLLDVSSPRNLSEKFPRNLDRTLCKLSMILAMYQPDAIIVEDFVARSIPGMKIRVSGIAGGAKTTGYLLGYLDHDHKVSQRIHLCQSNNWKPQSKTAKRKLDKIQPAWDQEIAKNEHERDAVLLTYIVGEKLWKQQKSRTSRTSRSEKRK